MSEEICIGGSCPDCGSLPGEIHGSCCSRHEPPPDYRGPAIIVEGGVIGGFKFIGPFEHIDAALKWHKEKSLPGVLGLSASVVLLVSPESEQVITADVGHDLPTIDPEQFM